MRAAAVLGFALSACGGAPSSYAAVSAACEAAEAGIEAACDPGPDHQCRGEITNAEADAQIDCTRAVCERALSAIEDGAE